MGIRSIRRFILPSRTLATYMVKMHLSRFSGILIGLTVVLLFLDLLANSDNVLKPEGSTWVSLLTYVGLRGSQLVSQFLPFAVLLASLLTFATLNQHSEVIIMKASGMSAHNILFPLMLASTLIAGFHFIFNETALVRSNAELDYWRANDYAVDLPPNTNLAGRVWIKEGNQVILAESVNRVPNSVVLVNVSIYERDAAKRLTAMTRADLAVFQNGEWTLHDVRRFDTETHELTVSPVKIWDTPTRPTRFMALSVRANHVALPALWSSIQRLDAEGIPTDRLMASFMQKFAGPASTLIMPLLAAIAAFGLHRAGSLALRVVLGMALGFGFFIADNFMLAMGEFGVAPPFLAAWGPFFLFLLLGYAVIFHTEEGHGKAVKNAKA